MELFNDIVRLYHANIIKPLFASIVTVVVVQKLFRQIPLANALAPLRWAIIIYGIFGVASAIITFTAVNTSFERAIGPYWWSYWLIFICTCILPFFLMYKKLKYNIAFMLLLSLLINLGWLLELFVILATSIHRDYLPSSWPDDEYVWSTSYIFGVLALQGLIVALLSILIGYLSVRFSKKNNFVKSFN